MRKSLCKIQYVLYVLLMFALSACGTTGSNTADKASGKISAKIEMPAAKTVALQADVTMTRLIVTGPTIPTAKQDFAGSTGGTIEVYPGSDIIVTAQAFNAAGIMLYEGFATNVTVVSGQTTDVGTIVMKAPVVKTTDTACQACHESTRDKSGQNLVADYKQSGHYTNTSWTMNAKNGSTLPGCAGCHGINHNDTNPAASGRCYECHGAYPPPPHNDGNFSLLQNKCNSCHNSHSTELIKPAAGVAGCTLCHSIAQDAGEGFVQDNNGVRSITQEFTKWSHHVTGVTLNDAHCAACHLEAKAEGGKIVVDVTKHMVDAKTHLRNSDTDADFAWDPAAPDHSGMDTYCMSCHDANGASSTGSKAIQAFINANGIKAAGKTASPSNPFGDTISNRYDKMQRPAVVNVDSQFNTTNNSHHGVKGPRYTGRTRAAGSRQIANPGAFANNSSADLYGARSTIYDSVNAFTKVSEFATNPAFNALYVPLENAGGEAAPRTGAAGLGDDSTLHCGDCHTVGQFKPNSTKNAAGNSVATVIGAHGSNNEYLLRNDQGSDERHTQEAYTVSGGIVTYTNPNSARLVCYNCHSFKRYGSVYSATGATGPHAGEYDSSGRCNGVGNTIPFNGYTTGTATDGTQFLPRIGELSRAAGSSTPAFAPGFPLNYANAPGGIPAATYTGEQNADFGNIFGIQCLNCHNSGVGNGYGGIHGSANNSPGTANTGLNGGASVADPSVTGGAYVDGMGNTNKVQRFLPGLGNVMHVPGTLGGFTGGVDRPSFFGGVNYTIKSGGISNDANWEQIGWKQIPGNPVGGSTGLGAGCYTLNDEGAGGSLDRAASPTQGLKGQPWDGTTTQTPNAAKTWGGCDDHTGQSVGGGDHGFYKRINRPVTY